MEKERGDVITEKRRKGRGEGRGDVTRERRGKRRYNKRETIKRR